MNPVVEQVTAEIRQRSQATRARWLQLMHHAWAEHPPRKKLSCGNLAHGYAACEQQDKQHMQTMNRVNLGIINSYNDVLSAHQPLAAYPEQIRRIAREQGCTAQVAGGVPAMCDGVTQGQPGMELSLLSRDVIAMATAISLSHNLFDGVLCLGVCDKIVPGMLIGALQFAHLPVAFVPAGPMKSGLGHREKVLVRKRFAEGKASRRDLLDAESSTYHGPGTCTFYGTANSNQILMEILGVQLPGASFINPDHPLRAALTRETVIRLVAATRDEAQGSLSSMVTEASMVNAIVGLLATGGSTNHTLHLVAIAQAAGIDLRWQDFASLSRVVPLLARIYPNGDADINAFQQAGGTAFLIRELRRAKLLNEDVVTLMGAGLEALEHAPQLAEDGTVSRDRKIDQSLIPEVLTSINTPFDPEGGLRLLSGNLGEAIIKVSSVLPQHRRIQAPCRIFHEQDALKAAFDAGELEHDLIAVVRFQGPRANGMPELHQLTPWLGILQDRGFQVALLTDGRMSGASGKVPAAIHLTPEAEQQGPICKLRDGDLVLLDANEGILQVCIDAQEWDRRSIVTTQNARPTLGRVLFDTLRSQIEPADRGASILHYTIPAK